MTETQELYRGVCGTANEATLLSTARRARASRPRWSRSSVPATACSCRCSAGSGTCSPRSPSARWPRCTRSRCRGGRCSRRRCSRRRSCACSPHLLALVQGDTSTTMLQPLDEVGAICAKHGVLFYTRRDRVARRQRLRGGRLGAGCRDRRAAEVPRRSVRIGADHACRDARRRGDPLAQEGRGRHPRATATRMRRDFIRSNYFDLGMILDYWGPRRLNHHTEATSMLYARPRVRARAAARGGPRRRDRAAPAARRGDARGRARARARGVRRRRAQDEQRRRGRDPRRACRGTPRAPRCSGLRHRDRHVVRPAARQASGASARWATTPARTPCCTTLAALEAVLRRFGASVPAGGGVDAAMDVYADANWRRLSACAPAARLAPDVFERRRGA